MQQKSLLLLAAACALFAHCADAHCNYLIKKGDNLFDLAEAYGVNETYLLQLNPDVADKELIFAGDTLSLPCEGGDATEGDNIFDLLAHRSDLSVLFKALAKVGLLEDFDDGSLDATLFAPTDAAFTKLLQQLNLTAGALLNDTALVSTVLSYHLVPGDALYADDLKNGKSYETALEDKKIKIKKNKDGVFILTIAGQEVPVEVADLQAGDAVVHIIGDVLLPLESAAPAPAPGPKAPGAKAPAPAAPVTPPVNCTYTVVEGDSLFDIGQRFNVTVEQLQALNPTINDAELIFPDQEVKVC